MTKVIEGLLPVDPVGALDKIKGNYLRYFETAYKFEERYPGDDLDQRKNEEMQRNNNLFHEHPYCEIIPEYVSEGKSLSRLIQELPDATKERFPRGFADFINRGLMDYPPYNHQFESLVSSFVEGKNTVITSGTGSGKTESFMLPLLASLFKEMGNWPAQHYNCEWYNPKDGQGQPAKMYEVAAQRAGETRPASIRALIMYPMNALVEDQIARLRKAIDGDGIREYLDDNYGHNRIFFGQYNSSTIGHKSLDGIVVADDPEKKKCLDSLSNYAKNYQKLLERKVEFDGKLIAITDELNYPDLTPERRSELETSLALTRKELKKIDEARYIAPRLSSTSFSAEMVTRWDMQDKAPDILITNFSMLSAMMMRSSERKMFEDSRRWFKVETEMDRNLTEEQKEMKKNERVFHLILDELHLYRGTAGTEVAYLIRAFLNEIGVPPVVRDHNGHFVPNKQLRIIASSASLDDPQDFLKQFFGVYDETDPNRELFNIISGSDYLPDDPRGIRLNYGLFRVFSQRDEERGIKYIDEPASQTEIKEQFIKQLNDPSIKTIAGFVEKYRERIFYDFKELCRVPNEARFVPRSLNFIAKELFDGDHDALRGFFIFRADQAVKDLKLPRFRFHQFFKYVEGLWGELTEETQNDHQQVIGDIMYSPQEVVKKGDTAHKVLELLRCECCGELFIGGNRRTVDPDNYYLTLNYPELTKIPNRNPTPMVQNKRYPAYAIFWPHEDHFAGADFPPISYDGLHSFEGTGFRGNWRRAYLNPIDGKMELDRQGDNHQGWIKGYTYYLSPHGNGGDEKDEKDIMALPCVCPHCDKDYRKRKYTKSPIRSFRSGISRSNQMICKELFYQLPSDNRKLIGFSDSRQDAAEQAANIATEHYRDMVRLSFMECVSEPHQDADLEGLKTTIVYLITTNAPDSMIQDNINRASVNDRYKQLLAHYAQNRDIDAINGLHCDEGIIPLADLVSSGDRTLGGKLVAKLLRMGINPAGPEYADQTIGGEHWSSGYDFHNLCAKGNMDAGTAQRVRDRLAAAVFHNSFGEYFKLSAEDAGLGYLGIFHFEERNRYYVELRRYLERIHIDVQEFLNAYIRVLGDHYRYNDPDAVGKINNNGQDPQSRNWDSFANYTDNCKKHIETIADRLTIAGVQITKEQLGDLVHNALTACGISMAELKLDGSLGFYTVARTARYFECPTCHRVHLHWGMGICTNVACRRPLDREAGGRVEDIYNRNFVAYDLMRERRESCRIHTEELSGQTDDQASRLLEFKGIILDNPEQSLSREIDMINVTTTMEVGVDIGGLLAVFQGNMPPTRYNYQQRVGRGGRRGQPFSTAITFCRGKSHDTYYYKDAVDEMLGGIPTQPKLSIKPIKIDGRVLFNDEIVRRVILKHVLHLAMSGYVVDETDIDPLDVVGEFGLVEDWQGRVQRRHRPGRPEHDPREPRPYLIEWLDDHQQTIESIVHFYLDQYNAAGDLDRFIANAVSWYTDVEGGAAASACIRSIDAAISVANCRGIGQCLAEAGLLPLYGMPSNSRVLYHGWNPEKGEWREIDRPVEQSITEFAPGAVKTKDHGYYQSAGLTTNFKMSKYSIKTIEGVRSVDYNDRRWDVFEFCHRMTKDESGNIISITRQAEDINAVENEDAIPIIIPKAYRTNRIFSNRGRKSDNNDRGNYTQASIWVDASNNGGVVPIQNIQNADVRYWTCGGEDKPTVWYVNDNNGELFKGQRFFLSEERRAPRGGRTFRIVSDDSPKHISGSVDGLLDQIDVFPSFMVENPECIGGHNKTCHNEVNDVGQVASHSIALGAKKVTEMICISIHRVNTSLNLSVGGQAPGYEPGIIAAYYSAATLIQRAFADELDIQPDEIEISEIKIENGYPCIYMSDTLANGSGYVGMLMEKVDGNRTRLQALLEKIVRFEGSYLSSILKHRDHCTTSCPQCLRTYQNAGYHHILDWRLGVDLIKLMLDDTYDMGYADLDNTPYGDLREQMRIAGNAVAENRANVELKTRPNGHYYLSTKRLIPPVMETQENIVHPLWNHDPNVDQNFFELLRTGYKERGQAQRVPINNTPMPDGNIRFHF